MVSLEECFKKLERHGIDSFDMGRFVNLEVVSGGTILPMETLAIIDKKYKKAYVAAEGHFKRISGTSFQKHYMPIYHEMITLLKNEGLRLKYFTDVKEL